MAEDALLARVRKLLVKAEDPGCTPQEAEALTAKAAELMAKYGIDRALLAATQPKTDKPGDKIITIANPWARVQSHLLCGIGGAMRCQAVLLPVGEGARVHLFGFESDLERVDILYTSVLLQMFGGLKRAEKPAWTRSPRAWNRSWLLGFCSAVVARVRAAEQRAESEAKHPSSGTGAALVLASREMVIKTNLQQAYPNTRKSHVTYSGSGYASGSAAGQRANLGGTGLGRPNAGALTR